MECFGRISREEEGKEGKNGGKKKVRKRKKVMGRKPNKGKEK